MYDKNNRAASLNIIDKQNEPKGGGDEEGREKSEEGEPKEKEANFEERKYLLNDSQFSKFSHLLGKKTNLAFIQKLKETPLVHGKRFYPITSKDYAIIKNHIKSVLQEKADAAGSVKTEQLTSIAPPGSSELPKPSFSLPNNDKPGSAEPAAHSQIAATSSGKTSTAPAHVPIPKPSQSQRFKSIPKDQVWKPENWLTYRPKYKK